MKKLSSTLASVAVLVACSATWLVPNTAVAASPAACSGPQSPPTSPPSQAAAAGFKTLVFDDEFNSAATISPNNSGGYKWYTYDYYGVSLELPSSGYQVRNGCLTILTDASGFSAGLSTINSAYPTTGTFQLGYFEARMQFNPTGSQGGAWPAFWSYAVQALQGASEFAELDFSEAYPGGSGGATNGGNGVTLLTTIHQWFATGYGSYSLQNYDVPTLPAGFNYDAFHIYGCLWTADTIVWYVDNAPVMTVAIGSETEFSSIQQDRMFLVLGTGTNWPVTFDYVHVWR